MRSLHNIIFILPLLFFQQEGFSQSQFGISGSYISSIPYGANKADRHLNENYKSMGGYSVSIIFSHPVESLLKASYEVMYSDKAYFDDSYYGGLGTQRDYDIENRSRHVGIMSFLEFSNRKKVSFNIGAGLGLGLLMDHTVKGTILIRTGGQEELTVYNGKNESGDKIDFRIGVRGGPEISISKQVSLTLNAAYILSFSDLKRKDVLIQGGFLYSLKPKEFSVNKKS